MPAAVGCGELSLETEVDLTGPHSDVSADPARRSVGPDDGARGDGLAVPGSQSHHTGTRFGGLVDACDDDTGAQLRSGRDRRTHQSGVEISAIDQLQHRPVTRSAAGDAQAAIEGRRQAGRSVPDEAGQVDAGEVGGNPHETAAARLVTRELRAFEQQGTGAAEGSGAGGARAGRTRSDHDDVEGRRHARNAAGRRSDAILALLPARDGACAALATHATDLYLRRPGWDTGGDIVARGNNGQLHYLDHHPLWGC